MPEPIQYIAQGGRLVQKVVSITLVNNVTLNEHVDVPANKRWVILGIRAVNCDDVNRAMAFEVYKEAAGTNLLRRLTYNTGILANGAALQYPSYGTDTGSTNHYGPVILQGGNRITTIFVAGGASTGGTDADGLIVEYLEYDM